MGKLTKELWIGPVSLYTRAFLFIDHNPDIPQLQKLETVFLPKGISFKKKKRKKENNEKTCTKSFHLSETGSPDRKFNSDFLGLTFD